MDNYPRLSEMGVLHPEQIVRYSVNSIDYVDYLRIMYVRPKGSILPVIRSYEFPRKQTEIPADAKSAPGQVVMERCPELREAIDELDKILAVREQTQTLADDMLTQLETLEEDVAHHAACLRELIEKIKKAKALAD